MATLTGQRVSASYKDLLQVSNSNAGIDGTLRTIQDGEGTSGAMEISTAGVKFTGTVAYGSYSVAFGGNFSTGGAFTTSSTVSITGALSIGGAFTTSSTVSVTGALTTAAAFTTSGANALTLTTTGTTNVTLPTSGTLYGTATGSITSAQLLASLSDETGTGVAVFGTAPTITGPVIDTIKNNTYNVVTFTSSGVVTDYFTATSGVNNAATIALTSSQTNASFSLLAKGTGGVVIGSTGGTTTSPIALSNGTNTYSTSIPAWTGNRILTLPDVNVDLTVATQAQQETGTQIVNAVTSGRQHYHRSAAKFWIRIPSGMASISASYNVTSLTDNGVGDATVNLTTAYSGTTDISVLVGFGTQAGVENTGYKCWYSIGSASTIAVRCQDTEGNTNVDTPIDAVGFGDL